MQHWKYWIFGIVVAFAIAGPWAHDPVRNFFKAWQPVFGLSGVVIALVAIFEQRQIAMRNHKYAMERDILKEERDQGLKFLNGIGSLIKDLPERPTDREIYSAEKRFNELGRRWRELKVIADLYFPELNPHTTISDTFFRGLSGLVEAGQTTPEEFDLTRQAFVFAVEKLEKDVAEKLSSKRSVGPYLLTNLDRAN